MLRIVLLYLIGAFLLILYSREVSAALEGLGSSYLLTHWLVATGVLLPFRLLVLKRNRKRLSTLLPDQGNKLFSIPFSEFRWDLILWACAGLTAAAVLRPSHYILWQTALELIFGCLAVGLLVGMFDFLQMEHEMIVFLQEHPHPIRARPGVALSVAGKVTFLLGTVIIVSPALVSFMLLDDIRFLVEQRAHLAPDEFYAIFYELGIVTLVMLVYGVAIVGRFSANIKQLFNLQIETLRKVDRGLYNHTVPVATSDEFGVVAARTNRMIEGLKEREVIRETFGRYVSEEIRDLILSGNIDLDGQSRTATILFCDIRQFTTFTERRPPEAVVKRLNQYFTEMSAAIEKHEGLVLQFIGDEIEAVFGVPLGLEDHPQKAISAALEMRERLRKLNLTWANNAEDQWKHGIGIHTGELVAGNIGSPNRLSYLVVGDAVNVAARIQAMTKEIGCDILLSGATRGFLMDDHPLEYVGKFPVRGREQDTVLYKIPEDV